MLFSLIDWLVLLFRVLSEHLKLEAEQTQRKEDACKKWAVSLNLSNNSPSSCNPLSPPLAWHKRYAVG